MAAQEQMGHGAPIFLPVVPNSSPHLRDLIYMCVAPLNPHNTSIAVLCTLKPRNAHTLDLMQPVLGRPNPGTPVSSSQRRLWKEDRLLIRRFQVQACVVCSRRRRGGGYSLDAHNLLALWTPYTIERTSYIIWRTKYKMKMQDPLLKQK